MKHYSIQIRQFWIHHKYLLIFSILLIIHCLIRFYNLIPRADFGWDQVDSAWAAKRILTENPILLQGVPVKSNSGLFMGPLYYYFVSIFYFFTNLHPIASPICAAFSSIISFTVLFIITKKIFNTHIAFISIVIYTFSLSMMKADRIQNAAYFIPVISYLIFYCLYKVINGNEKYIIALTIVFGLSLHVDFTSIFYIFLILCTLPFFPRNKKSFKYILFSLFILFLFASPILISEFGNNQLMTNSSVSYFSTYFHGLHLQRVLQLSHDAFISFESILIFPFFRPFVFVVLPLFMIFYYYKKPNKESFKLFYLMALWIVIPWLILSTYAGELTDYYFSIPRFFVISTLSYLIYFLFQKKQIFIKLFLVLFLIYYGYYSLSIFFQPARGNLLLTESYVKSMVSNKQKIPYNGHESTSYFYYWLTTHKK